jgi:hypothetical protein
MKNHMKKSCKWEFLLLLAATPVLAFAERGDTLFVNLTDRTSAVYQLNGVEKLTFTGKKMVVNKNAGAFDVHSFQTLENLTFAPLSSDIVTSAAFRQNAENELLTIFPNPVENELNLAGSGSEKNPVEIFDLAGRRLLCVKPARVIDVSSLASGVYFLKTGKQLQKFIKK